MPNQNPIDTALANILSYIPNLISAIIIFIVGWLIAVLVGQVVTSLLQAINVDSFLDKLGLKKLAGQDLSLAKFAGWLTKIFIIFIALIAVADTLQLPQISLFISQISGYIPNVIAATVIVILGVVAASAVAEAISRIAGQIKVISADLAGAIAKWAILIFTVFAALIQLQIAPTIIQILFAGLVATLTIALGLAFGIGGQEQAKKLLESLMKKR